MIGWKLQCKMSDGTTQSLPLKNGKESNPVEAAKYAVAAGLTKQPVCAWWVLCTLCMQDHIIKLV